MSQTKSVNEKIFMKNDYAISSLFKTNHTATLRVLSSISIDKVNYPFNHLLAKQKILLEFKTYACAKDLLTMLEEFIENMEWANFIIKRIVYNAYSLSGNENFEDLAKILLNIYKQLVANKIEAHVYVANLLFKIYFYLDKFRMAENFLLVVKEPTTKNRDYYIFNYYKGLINILTDNFSDAYREFLISFKRKRLRNAIAAQFFISSMMVGNFIKPEYLKKYNCLYLYDLITAVKNGMYTHVDFLVDNIKNELLELGLYRVVMVHAPLVSFTNLVKRVYGLYGKDSRLNLQFIMDLLEEHSFEEITCILGSLICAGRIKGYISVNKKILVMSRVDPFPVLITETADK